MAKAEKVNVRKKPLAVAAWRFEIRSISGDIELGDIHGFVIGVTQILEGKIEKTWNIFAFFDVVYIVVFDLE
jgi:hypothetical protein